jgi:hypothetical protein
VHDATDMQVVRERNPYSLYIADNTGGKRGDPKGRPKDDAYLLS